MTGVTGGSSRVVILGNGVASLTAVRTLRREGFQGSITVISDEQHRTYARMLVPYYVSGRLDRERLFMAQEGFHQRLGVELLLGQGAVGVDAGKRLVNLGDGREVAYDRLLVATGSRPYLPRIKGIDGQGVLGLRSLADGEGMRRLAIPGQAAVVLGGGLVSLMAAEALNALGMSVTVVVTSPHVLSQLLNPDAARMVESGLLHEGINLLARHDAVEAMLDAQNRVEQIRLDNQETMPCRVLVVGKGVRPCIEALQETGLSLERGLPVDGFLSSAIPEILAAGDVAVAPDWLDGRPRVVATQTNAIQQGVTAALNMLGKSRLDDGGLPINIAHFGGVHFVTAGYTGDAGTVDREEVVARSGTYRRYLFRDDRLVGVVLVGDISNASRLIYLIRGKVELRKKLDQVLKNTLAGWRRGEV